MGQPPPTLISWEITRACNLSCKHCGSAAGFEREAELDTGEALAVCEQLDAFPDAYVSLTGGEPLVRSDWAVLVEELIRRRRLLGLQSNGWALDEERVRDLARLQGREGRITVGLSLDGDEATHDRIRRPGSYARVRRALAALRAGGFACALITTVHRLNLDRIEHVGEVAREHGCYCWQIQVTTRFGRAAEENDLVIDERLYGLVAERVAALREALQEDVPVMTADSIGYMGRLEPRLRPHGWSGCQAGLQTLAVQSNGDVKGCLFLLDDRFREGNVRETPLEEIWSREEAFAYNRGFDASTLVGPCARCEHATSCRAGCRALSFSTHGRVDRAGFCLHAQEQGWTDLDRGVQDP